MEQTICQSCGMPLTNPEQFGTNADGNVNHDYCIYCYKDGKFIDDVSMEEKHGRIYRYVLSILSSSWHDKRRNERIMHKTIPNIEKMEEKF